MNDVSCLADQSEAFANFLTVSRKFGLSCTYVFYTIYPARHHWKMIFSQTKIFNFFPGLGQASFITGTLFSYCSAYKYNYVPKRDFWINRLYFDISNSTNKQCLTIDTRDINDLGPAKFRTEADNNKEQICYYKRKKKDTSFNSFLALRKKTSSAGEIIFSIVNIIDKTNKNKNIYFEINDELSDFKNDGVQYNRKFRRISEGDNIREKSTDRRDRQQRRNDRRVSKKPRFLSKKISHPRRDVP